MIKILKNCIKYETFDEITSLDNYNDIKYLNCCLKVNKNKGTKQHTSLPPLPRKLEWLNCSNNMISELPELPCTLRRLDCNDNKLTFLPTLPFNINIFMLRI